MMKFLPKTAFTFLLSILLLILSEQVRSQVLISNSEGTPDNSAMLEIQSTSGGVLIPRMTSVQRTAISNPKEGLLVYDTDYKSFFIYGKDSKGTVTWYNLSANAGLWSQNGNAVYLSNSAYNVGIGTDTPKNKLVIKANSDTDTLMEIQDRYGNPLMVITPQLTKFNFVESVKGVSGGFAVGRYATAKDGKAYTDTALLLVTPDSSRIYTSGVNGKGISGGFAVGRYATAKGKTYVKKSFYTNYDSTRVYTDGTGTKGVSGGFAVGRYATAKGTQEYNFFTDIDSTRVFTGGLTKGVSGGFAVGRYATAKGSKDNYMYMVPENYFIGHQSGEALQNSTYTGKYNLFCGFESGISDTSGSNNSFFGYRTGYNNTAGSDNTFLGDSAGFGNTEGEGNLFVGKNSGMFNTVGNNNSFVGYESGYSNTTGTGNAYVGSYTGYSNTVGEGNSFIGFETGYNNVGGNYNMFAGYRAGYNNADGYSNSFIGYEAGYYNVSGIDNVFIGKAAGYYNKKNFNIFIGREAGFFNTDTINLDTWDGTNNIFVGLQAGFYNKIGKDNVFIGTAAGLNSKKGNYNVFIGNVAGYSNAEGDYNVFIGRYSGHDNTTGTYNTFLGNSAGSNNIDGYRNTFVGAASGLYNESGDYNVYLGYYSGFSNVSGSDNVFIGHSAGYYETGSDKFYLSNLSGSDINDGIVRALMYGDFNTHDLRINAEVNIYDQYSFPILSGTSGQVLVSQGLGNQAIWADQSTLNDADWTISGNDMYSAVSGNVGIGTTAPEAPLDVETNASGYAIHLEETSTGTEDWQIGVDAAGNLDFFDSGTETITFEDGGNVGLGTTNPAYNLDIQETVNTTSPMLRIYQADVSGDASVMFSTNGGNTYTIGADASDGDKFKISDYSYLGINDRFVITNTGQVGIGISTPGESLDVSGNIHCSDIAGIGTPTNTNYGLYVVNDYYSIYAYTDGTGSGQTYAYGVKGYAKNATSNIGVYGQSAASGTTNYGVYGYASGATTNWSGYFVGNVRVTGTLDNSKSVMKIDHPLDPENKYLQHSSVESPDMMNIYNGNITLDANGEAIVNLPDYFEAFNMDFRYQLTAISAPGPNLYIKQKIKGNKFMIAGGKGGMEVSWQVTGIRNDPFAQKNRIKPEVDKKSDEKGKYLHPESYDKPEELGTDYREEEQIK